MKQVILEYNVDLALKFLYVAMHLFRNRQQMTSRCGKEFKKDVSTNLVIRDVLVTFLIFSD